MKKKICLIILSILVLALVGMLTYIYWDNSRVVNTVYKYESERVPESFDGFRIVLITDFHNSPNYETVAEAVEKANPDIICISGDLVDMNTDNFTNTKKFIREITKIATVYYTYGNHEQWSTSHTKTEKPVIGEEIDHMGVVMLNDKVKTLEKQGQKINLIGYGDNIYEDFSGIFETRAKTTLTKLGNTLDKSVFSILLFHRAQYFDMVSELPYDLVLSGHLHGGQVNIKYIREKILRDHFGNDKFIKGRYQENGHDMIVSGGIALKDNLYRIFNTPEIVTVELKAK